MPDPNPFTEEADQVDEQDQPSPPVRAIAPPPATAPVGPVTVAAPGSRVVAPPVGYPGNAEAIGMDTQFRSMVNQGMPIQQASAAVEAAIKFQAQRGYQNDLQAGMAPAAALAKWAPMLFTGGRGSNLGEAASFIRATTPTAPKPINAQGILYNVGPGGQSVSVTPGQVQRQVRQPVSEFDKATFSKNLTDIDKAIEAEDYRRANKLRLENEAIQAKYGQPKAPPVSPASAAATPAGGRVRVRRKDGKIGTVPASQVDAALAAGYTRVQ